MEKVTALLGRPVTISGLGDSQEGEMRPSTEVNQLSRHVPSDGWAHSDRGAVSDLLYSEDEIPPEEGGLQKKQNLSRDPDGDWQ